MSNPLKLLTVSIFTILAITGVLSTLIETNLWNVSKVFRLNIIRFHVSWSVIACVVLGVILEGHVRKVIKTRFSVKKFMGVILLLLLGVMILSSFAIRHFKTPTIHSIVVTTHWVTGLISIVVMCFHFVIRKKT